ncbi:MAG: GntR family transcriptional regulator [Chitinivibrionales bacterium]|nr:GntR family transcriptional regulator [Chitinivibrionales bacterium]
MNKTVSSPGIRRGVQFIVRSILDKRFVPGQPLPGIKEISSLAGISYATMAKAMADLQSRGIVTSMRGSRSLVLSGCESKCRLLLDDEETPPPAPADIHPLWYRIAEKIKEDVFNGVYSPGIPFPSIKELTARYDASYASLKKSLALLCTEKIIHPFKRTYVVPQLTSTQRDRHIVYLTTGDTQRRLHWSALYEEGYRMLEKECNNCRIGFQPLAYHADDGPPFFAPYQKDLEDIPDNEQIMGYLLSIIAPHTGLDSVLKKMGHIRKPIAILDVTGSLGRPSLLDKPNVRLFTAAVAPSAGIQVARYLLQLGHRRIAYLSPFHDSVWSPNRLQGLVQVYESAGIADAVVPVVLNNPSIVYPFYQKAALDKSSLSSLVDAYNKWKLKAPSYFARELDPVFNFQLPVRTIPYAEYRQQLHALFAQALKDPGITAWVAANDDVALAALDFLNRKNIAVPGRISLIGFDDTTEALQHHLTSYNFNIQTLMRLMLSYVVNTRSLPQRKRAVEVDGMIVERATVGKI